MAAPAEEWRSLEDEIRACKKCRLASSRTNPVPGEGNRDSQVMFVGEAPGRKEDEWGRPFVGPAGQLLTELIEKIGVKRDDVYITNVVKCRPPNNRDPADDEIEACLPYLLRQMKLIKPNIIIALGRHSARTLFSLMGMEFSSMRAQHGKPVRGRIEGIEVVVIPTFHPASALYNPQLKTELERDFVDVVKLELDKLRERPRETARRTLLDFVKRSRSPVPPDKDNR